MITITRQNDGVLFEFEDSKKYLYGNGSILVPFNTLSIVADESDMIILKKAASNDVFLSARYDTDLGYRSKDDAIDDLKDLLFAETGGGGSGSGMTSGEVQTMIDESISGKADTSAVTAVDNALSAYSATTDARLAEDEEVTAAALNDLQENKADTSAVTAVQQSLSGKQDTLVSGTNIKTINNESILGSGNITISGGGGQSLVYYTEDTSNESATIMVQNYDDLGNRSDNRVFVGGGDIIIESYNETDDGEGNTGTTDTQVVTNSLGLSIVAYSDDGIDTTQTELKVQPMGAYINSEPIATEPYVNAAISGKVDTSAITTAITSGSTDDEIPTAKATYDAIQAGGGGSANVIELTQAQYDALTTIDPDAIYVITDATAYDPSTKVDTSAITSSITSGSTDAQVPSAKATYDAITAATTGGGATYSAGSGIAIDTANTISVSEPIHAFGHNVMISESTYNPFKSNTFSSFGVGSSHNFKNGKGRAVAFGASNTVNSDNSLAQGSYVTVNNIYEAGFGFYNNSATGSTASGQTLFSVGNGTADNARHNAFEIRQNGDIYVNDGTNDVRLQDTILALGGLKLVKLTQSEYDQLATKDANTLYIISNVVS